jgi:hypothetical protein
MDSSGSREDRMAGPCEHHKEILGSIKGRKYLEQPSSYQFLKHDYAAWC